MTSPDFVAIDIRFIDMVALSGSSPLSFVAKNWRKRTCTGFEV
jgi:hypothetical protein